MERIVHGIVFEGKRVEDAWDVTTWEKAGHREISVRQAVEWTEKRFDYVPFDPRSMKGEGYKNAPTAKQLLEWAAEDASDAEARREKSVKKSAQRAQTMCRRIIKAEGFNELLTITYRENQTDREVAKQHFEKWVRRMKAALGGDFRYCASFEKQERGAMHMHVACHKLPKHATHKGTKIEGWRLGTDVWRGIVGKDNGLVFVGGRKQKGLHKKAVTRSPAKMAQYVSKYIMKDYADSPGEKNRYSRSNGSDVPKPSHLRLTNATLCEAIGAVFECADGDVVVSHRMGHFKDSYWLCTEPDLRQHKV